MILKAKHCLKVLLPLGLSVLFCHKIVAQRSVIHRPFKELRFEESYQHLKDSLPLTFGTDRIKYLPLKESADWFGSLGGEIRQTIEGVRLGFRDQENDFYLLTRTGLHGSINHQDKFRVFGEILSSLEYDRLEGPRLVDENRLYVLNLFAEFQVLHLSEATLKIRIGRQEMQFGSSSLFAIRDGTNVRYTFDGVSALYESEKLNVKSFFAEFVRQDLGVFDDQSLSGDKKVWGTYLDYVVFSEGTLIAEPFYAGITEQSFYHQTGLPTVNDRRHSFGLRLYGKVKGWDYGGETIIQSGETASLSASAHQAAFQLGKTFNLNPKHGLRLGWSGYYATGDRDSLDNQINTFNPYFPLQSNLRGAFGTLTFPTNLVFTGPSLRWIYNRNVISTISYDLYWRPMVNDGLMNPGGFPSVFPDNNDDHFLGSQVDVSIVYLINKYLNLVGVYSHFFESEYTRLRPASNSATDFFTALLIVRF